jgi:DNA-binding response OmpR family regulator
LRRELAAEGYQVELAKDGREVLGMLDKEKLPDLLVLDLEIPHGGGVDILRLLQERKPMLPVVVHTLLTEYMSHPVVQKAAAFVEKTGDNIENFKAVILEVLWKSYPQRKRQPDMMKVRLTEFEPKSRNTVP